MAGEAVFERGERGDEMFLIVEGGVVLHAGPHPPPSAENSGVPQQPQRLQGGAQEGQLHGAVNLAAGERIAGKGDVFGEGGLFPEELGPLRLESARTLSFVSALVLTAASMREIEAEYPAVRSAPLPLASAGPDLPNVTRAATLVGGTRIAKAIVTTQGGSRDRSHRTRQADVEM